MRDMMTVEPATEVPDQGPGTILIGRDGPVCGVQEARA
jgi:hypothetical protein